MYNIRQNDLWRNDKLNKSSLNYDKKFEEAYQMFNRLLSRSLLRLSAENKSIVVSHMLQPECAKMTHALAECDKPMYEELARMKWCKSKLWKETDDYGRTILSDSCKYGGAWLLGKISVTKNH
jgi:hypothetical protein